MLQAVIARNPNKTEVSISEMSTGFGLDLEANRTNDDTPRPVHGFDLWSVFRSCLNSLMSFPSPRPSLQTQLSSCCRSHPPLSNRSMGEGTPLVLDLRSREAFSARHTPRSLNLPLPGLTPDLAGGDLFGDPESVFSMWNATQSVFSGPQDLGIIRDVKENRRAVIVVCYDGDVSRLVTSTLRNQGVEAFSVKGGVRGLDAVV